MKYSKSIVGFIILVFLVSLFLLFRGYINNEIILDRARGDINGNGKSELVVLTKDVFSKYGKEVIVYSNEKELYRKDISNLKPWKLTMGDIDGDSVSELSIGVYKKTIFHQVMAKRPFIYSFQENELEPKWRGSRLSRPFTDYLFYDLDASKSDEIISIESLESGKKIINTYKWKGFGFEGFVESESFENIVNLRLDKASIYVDIEDGKKTYTAKIKLVGEDLLVEDVGR